MPRTTRIEIILFAALCFFLPSIPSTTVQGGDLASRKACVNKFLPLLRQRVLYIQYQRLIRISGGSDDMSEFEQLRSAEDKMDDVESVEESMPPRESIPSEQETTPSEDEQEEQKPLEEEDMELDHDSLSEHEQEDSEVVLKRKLDELVTMTDKDIFDKFYDRSKSQQAKRPNEKQRSMAEAKFRADDFDNHVQVVDNKIVIGQRRKAVNQREEKQRRELRLFDMLVQNATWAEAATRAYRFHHYEDFDITKPVSFNADQEFIKNWAGAVRGAVALRKGICLPSFPVPKQPINDVRYPGGSCMPDPECPPITHQVELFPISRIPMDELVGRVGGSVPSSRRKTCLPFPLDHPANSSIRERYYKPVRATRDMTRGKKKEMMQGATYTREFIEAQYRKAEQRRSRDEDFEQHLKVMFPYQDILPDGLLNTSSSRTEQYFKLPHHWYLGSENRRFGLPKDRGGGMEMEGAGEGGQEMLGDPKRGFGSRWERMDLFDLETPPPQTFDLDEDRVVLEDGSIVNKRTRLRQLLNGTVVPLDSSDDVKTPDARPTERGQVLLTEEQMSDRFVSIMQAHKDKLYSLLRPQDYGNATQGQEVVQDETSPVPKDNAEGEEEEEDAAFVRIPAGKHVEDEQTIKLMKMMSRGAKEGKELRISAGLHRWLDKLRFQPGTTRWMNPTNGQTETMANQRWLRIRGDERGDVAVTGKLGGACLWGQWKVYHGTRGWLERVSLILDTDCCYRPTFQVQGGNWSVTDCEVRAILTITMVVRDFAAVKMKDCVIGGCDFGWFVATDGVVVKDRARVRMKGGRGEYVAALGCVASSDGMSEVTVEKMLVHR
ncbi:hypothetical protein GUITHDRAFT_121757 [Guillardia theta CCMP2712]|uniref:Uncharacterized protein n=1 Tax=Guillardia theta (strain CCMP2712) TaxID=905079 RepID=L1I7J0_GUITC|nr:hypothetical protein GUITHDRAFT_121757 [Guillardia theta CCMP2712]EKX32057.1 hypothetical protein GUITHDRAFT_121757 [Guillardia theta CCMP2712]|eukprot:XP_005819037.1 hypothetical protein GUITHDRAFT_121757 [Guillardia theta CCMP2712]